MAKVILTPEDLIQCESARAILEKDISRHHPVAELARTVGMNQTKLKAGFKHQTGKSVYEYVTALRMEKAKELLETTWLPIDKIANRLGWDHSNLIRRFRKFTGVTPKEWRNNSRNIRTSYAS